MPYSPPSTCSSSSSDDDNVYVNKDIKARYSKLRKETLIMKKQAKEEIERLRKVVEGIEGNGGGRVRGRGEKKGEEEAQGERITKERRKVEREARRKQHEYEKERKERIFMTVSAAAAAQKEDAPSPEKNKPTPDVKQTPPSQPSWHKPASSTKVHVPSPKPKPTFKNKNSRFNTAARPTRYTGSSKPTSTPATSAPKNFSPRVSPKNRPGWDNGKGHHRRNKDPPAGKKKDNVRFDVNDLFPNGRQRNDFSMDEIRASLDKAKRMRNRKFRPETVKDDESSEDEEDVKPNVQRVRPNYNYSNVAEEKYKRERKGRLNANRAALGLDGPPPPVQPNKSKEKSKTNDKKGNNQHKSGVKYSDPLEAELNKFRERAKREEANKKLDDIAVRTYMSMWTGFEAMALRSENSGKIRYSNIPWLPKLTLTAFSGESWRTLGCNDFDAYSIKKKAVRRETIRWHPDKFMSRFGRAIWGEEWGRVEEGVKEVTRRVGGFRERLEKEQQESNS
ncbi:hypothetical protein TrLO_g1591 [Triparma laevis f. longispina]|uniref:Uncharacterized protein n=1 Tax=Triparma laevis f. longispina TaxID=1714387 RepID=A0A9W7CFM2_9STRA|nr:hypothetical protein TrLO_g1591 [Triparma laevis f. longispina]